MKLPKKTLLKRLFIIAVTGLILLIIPRIYVHFTVQDMVAYDESQVKGYDVAIVLGNQAFPGYIPSDRVSGRCDKAIELYKAGIVKKILMSGDGRTRSNDEPETMKRYAIGQGVSAKDILKDSEGFSTFESMNRANKVFHLNKLVVVTQGFHIDRSLYFCKEMGIDAVGAGSNPPGRLRDIIRECPACITAIIEMTKERYERN